MIPIISLFVVITVSILVTKFATVALTHTGLSRESARFQARSAFTGVGFTTSESESIVNHPVRRKIFMLLMLFGNAGIVTVIATLVLTFINIESSASAFLRILLLLAGLAVLWIASGSKWVDKRLSKVIGWAIKKYTKLDVRDYASLLHVAGEYKVTELFVEPDDWLAGGKLDKLRLQDEGIMVLGITREDGTYIGAPVGSMIILPGDKLVLYGRDPAFESLDSRRKGPKGDSEHREAVEEQLEIELEEKKGDSI